MKTTTENKIKNVKTLGEFLDVLNTDFKASECKPSRFIKSTLIYILMNKLSNVNSLIANSVKLKALEAENIEQFINVIKLNFNCQQEFTTTTDLLKDFEKLIILTSLKEKDEIFKTEAPTEKAPMKKNKLFKRK